MTVVGVTREPKDLTEAWVKKHGAMYPYAYDKAGSVMRELGLSGYPSAALVSPSGTIVWTGHPAGLKQDLIEI